MFYLFYRFFIRGSIFHHSLVNREEKREEKSCKYMLPRKTILSQDLAQNTVNLVLGS